MKPSLLTDLLRQARNEELGLVVETNNQKRLQVTLDEHKKAIGDFDDLMVCVPNEPNLVYITHKSIDLDA